MVTKIISGGQTGADRAALDWAIANGFDHGGWCPSGRRAEDGAIPAVYNVVETPAGNYQQRTKWNVRDSDGTVIFSVTPELVGGSKRTAEYAERAGKPCLHLHPGLAGATLLREFVALHRIRVLNVAGPRASGAPDIGQFVRAMLSAALLPRAQA